MKISMKIIVLICVTIISVIVQAKVVVFLYHRFDDARYPSTNTWTTELENHIRLVKEVGFEIWTIRDLEEYVYGRKKMNKDAVVFTVDDGYRSVYDKAYKIFKKYNVPFCIFLQVGAVGYPDYLTWEMIYEMLKNGVEFGNHSFGHPDFPSFVSKMGEEQMLEYFKSDLQRAQQVFKEKTGRTLNYYAYPYGHYIPQMIDILKEEGFKLAFTQNPGPYDLSYGAFEIPREPLLEDWATEKHLRYILNREPLVTENSPFVLQNGTITIKTKILIPKEVGYATLYVSEKGIIKSHLKDSEIFGETGLTRMHNRLMISANDGRKEYLRYYLIFNAQGE